jgi:hypothetical protein
MTEPSPRSLQEEQAAAYIGQDGGSAAVTSSDAEKPVVPRVPLAACLERFSSAAMLEDYHSAALGRKGQATKRTRFASFPPYLVVQVGRAGAVVWCGVVCGGCTGTAGLGCTVSGAGLPATVLCVCYVSAMYLLCICYVSAMCLLCVCYVSTLVQRAQPHLA